MEKAVSRAYEKIAGAANAFRYDFRDKTVLDIGSSTGGFTEFALSHGAKKVIAVEKGTRQMAKPLRFNSKIELHEKTDIFDFKPTEKFDVVLADVSFISLREVLSYAAKIFKNDKPDFLVMLKPQFEAKPEDLNKGIIKNEKIRRNIIKSFETWLKENGFVVLGKRDNTLTGKNGNLERFYFLKLNS